MQIVPCAGGGKKRTVGGALGKHLLSSSRSLLRIHDGVIKKAAPRRSPFKIVMAIIYRGTGQIIYIA